jgi:uncharacterized protein (TIGR00290 family)
MRISPMKYPMDKVIIGWSGGKDSAMAFHEAARTHEIVALLTTVTDVYDRISMHGVRTSLLRQQAEAIGVPLEIVTIPPTCANDVYEERMRTVLARHRANGVTTAVFGDIFLEDVRRYREERLLLGGFTGLFPIWGRDSRELARYFLDVGFRAVLCCVDTHILDRSFAGRLYDEELLADLPPSADPCGENGEFHTFVFDGPIFSRPIAYHLGEYTLRDERFGYRDLLPG